MKKKAISKPGDDPPDPWKEKLQETLKRDRPSPRRWGFWLGIVFLAGMGLLVWWLYPRPNPPLPPVVAFDVLALPGEAAPVLAGFEPQEEGEDPPRFEGRRLVFLESRLLPPGQTPARVEVVLETDGSARAALKAPVDLPWVAFKAYAPGKGHTPPQEDEAHIYARKAQSDTLLVAIEGTLSLAGMTEWQEKPFLEIPAVAEAAPALNGAQKEGFALAYLALESDRPEVYKKMRRWARMHFGPGKAAASVPLPEGPVLGRPDYPGTPDAAYAKLLADVAARFTGRRAAVTADPALAQRLQAAGWKTFLIGDGAPLPGIERVRRWEELPRVLGEMK